MQHRRLRFGRGFRVLWDCRGVQAAQMVIAPGGREGGPDNRHRGAEQWLYVVSGSGLAIVDGARRRLAAGTQHGRARRSGPDRAAHVGAGGALT